MKIVQRTVDATSLDELARAGAGAPVAEPRTLRAFLADPGQLFKLFLQNYTSLSELDPTLVERRLSDSQDIFFECLDLGRDSLARHPIPKSGPYARILGLIMLICREHNENYRLLSETPMSEEMAELIPDLERLGCATKDQKAWKLLSVFLEDISEETAQEINEYAERITHKIKADSGVGTPPRP